VAALGRLANVVLGQLLGRDDVARDAELAPSQVNIDPPQRADLTRPKSGRGAEAQEGAELRVIGDHGE
jgi:hypothetical protein